MIRLGRRHIVTSCSSLRLPLCFAVMLQMVFTSRGKAALTSKPWSKRPRRQRLIARRKSHRIDPVSHKGPLQLGPVLFSPRTWYRTCITLVLQQAQVLTTTARCLASSPVPNLIGDAGLGLSDSTGQHLFTQLHRGSAQIQAGLTGGTAGRCIKNPEERCQLPSPAHLDRSECQKKAWWSNAERRPDEEAGCSVPSCFGSHVVGTRCVFPDGVRFLEILVLAKTSAMK